MLGLRPSAEESLEPNLGFCCGGGVMIRKVSLSVRWENTKGCQPATVSFEGQDGCKQEMTRHTNEA